MSTEGGICMQGHRDLGRMGQLKPILQQLLNQEPSCLGLIIGTRSMSGSNLDIMSSTGQHIRPTDSNRLQPTTTLPDETLYL